MNVLANRHGAQAPFRPLAMKPPSVSVQRRQDGSILIESNHKPGIGPRSIAHLLADSAASHPDRPYMKQRLPDHGPWRQITYGEALRHAESIAQYLITNRLTGRPMMILSGNSIEHALVNLGCTTAGVPVVPVSPAYALASHDHAKLTHCAGLVRPGIVFAQSGALFAHALTTLRALDPSVIIVTVDGEGPGALALATLTGSAPTQAVALARDAIVPATIVKYLFTSGSTGTPKAAAQTHGMMAASIAGLEGLRTEAPDPGFIPHTLEWMPWSHLSAGNIGFNGVLWSGGTVFLDEGKPVAGLFETTLRNLAEVSPVVFASAPIAFGMLAAAMERDTSLRASVFRNLEYMAYGGATLSEDVYGRIQALAVAETGFRIPLTTMYGSTETQGVTLTHWVTERAGLVGLPLPGITLKLVPNGAKLEVRVKGPTVTNGYLGDPARTDAAFDDEGFYQLGDAARFIDEADPAAGLLFDGRVAEDFKLDTGTWVSVGVLRPALIAACTPLVQDMVLTGQDQAQVGLLIWPSAAAREAFRTPTCDLDGAALAAALRRCLNAHNRAASGASQRVGRFALLTEPPSIDSGEITDKGYINQRAVLERRGGLVAALHTHAKGTEMYILP